MPRVNKFMCHIELFVGCAIIGMINAVLSLIFAVYTILDIYNHNSGNDGALRTKRAPVYDGQTRPGTRFFDPFVFFKAALFIVYFLHFVYCFYLIGSALKKSIRNIQRYLLVSTCATVATFCEGTLLLIDAGFTEMALNYFAFTVWNIYFLICVYSYFKKYEEQSLDDFGEGVEAEVMRV